MKKALRTDLSTLHWLIPIPFTVSFISLSTQIHYPNKLLSNQKPSIRKMIIKPIHIIFFIDEFPILLNGVNINLPFKITFIKKLLKND